MVRFGFNVHYPTRRRDAEGEDHNVWDISLAAARSAEESGFDSIWYSDHFMFGGPGDDIEVELLECLTALGALAATTSRVKIGPYVLGAPYRNAALTAKIFTSLDVISHGRLIIALGAAWHRPEFEAYGYEFPPVGERMEILEETIQIVERMLAASSASYSGRHRSVVDALNFPRPVQRPRPPLMIGGAGERHTLRLVARYADMANIWGGTPEYVRHKYDVLRRHCEAIDRPYEEIVRSNHLSVLVAENERDLAVKREQHRDFPAGPPVVGTPKVAIERLREYVEAGSQYIIVDIADWQEDPDSIARFAETVMGPLMRE